MTRRRFYAPLDAFAQDNSITLGSDESRHLRNVLRLKRGDEVYVFDGEGREFRCSVANLTSSAASLDVIEEVEPAQSESPICLTLAVALLKGEKFDLVVQKAAELGVTTLVPVTTARADVRLRDAGDARKKIERWRRIALESAKQCGRARLMKIESPRDFAALAGDTKHGHQLRLMFAERDGGPLGDALRDAPPGIPVTAMIGSEGGWTDDEIDLARSHGWKIVTLGGRTLRAETAAIAAAALLQHALGDLR